MGDAAEEVLQCQNNLAGRLAGDYSEESIRRECIDKFNVTGSGNWPIISLGGYDGFEHTSNIVFSNGEWARPQPFSLPVLMASAIDVAWACQVSTIHGALEASCRMYPSRWCLSSSRRGLTM